MRAVAIIVLVAAIVVAILYFGEFVDFGADGTAVVTDEKIENAVDNAATETKDAVNDAATETKDAVNDAAKEVEKATE